MWSLITLSHTITIVLSLTLAMTTISTGTHLSNLSVDHLPLKSSPYPQA